MSTPHQVVLKLNQQQLELLDRTVAQGHAPDRASLVLHALREYAKAHLGSAVETLPGSEGAAT